MDFFFIKKGFHVSIVMSHKLTLTVYNSLAFPFQTSLIWFIPQSNIQLFYGPTWENLRNAFDHYNRLSSLPPMGVNDSLCGYKASLVIRRMPMWDVKIAEFSSIVRWLPRNKKFFLSLKIFIYELRKQRNRSLGKIALRQWRSFHTVQSRKWRGWASIDPGGVKPTTGTLFTL